MSRTRPYVRTTIEAPGTVEAHESNANPHRMYATNSNVSAALSAHVRASDPHAPYIIGVGIKRIYVQDTEPENPEVGDLWIDTSA